MINEITIEELKSRLDAGENVVLLDVRRPDEHEELNIPNSLLIPLQELEDRVGELEQYKDGEIVVYCRSGNRSGQACMFLTMSGFANPRNMRGGMLAW